MSFAVVMAALAVTACTGSKKESVMNDREPVNILIVVDLQKDFIDGTLMAKDAEQIIEPIRNITNTFDDVYFTLDWHPYNHCSFAEYGGPWPVHCVQYTQGAALPNGILDGLDNSKIKFLPKGNDPEKEEYGQFAHVDPKNQDLFVKGDNVVICGIASEYCVLETLKNLVALSKEIGFSISAFMDGIACIENHDPLLEYMAEDGIKEYKPNN